MVNAARGRGVGYRRARRRWENDQDVRFMTYRWATIGQSIKISIARQVIDRWKELGAPILARMRTPSGLFRFWQHGGGFDRNIRDREELAHEIQYTHRNPVRRGLVPRPEDWEWSSVHAWMGSPRPNHPVCELPPGDAKAWCAWRGFK